MCMHKTPDHKRSSIRFLIVGLGNSFFGLMIIYVAIWVFGINDVPANLLGYAFGIVLSFFLNSTWSFQYKGRLLPAFVKFVLVIMFAYCANLITVIAAIHILHVNNYFAHALGVVPYALVGYLGSRILVFAPSCVDGENQSNINFGGTRKDL